MQVCAVSAIGFAEGPSHTNWKKVVTIMLWWFVGFFCVCGATYVLVAQGVGNLFLFLLCSFFFFLRSALSSLRCAVLLPSLSCAPAPILCLHTLPLPLPVPPLLSCVAEHGGAG